MPGPNRLKKPLSMRAKIVIVSVLSFLVTSACAWLRSTREPVVTCYEMIAPTDSPTHVVTCYEPAITATPTPVCYTATPSPTTFTSPLPTPTLTPTPEARRLLREKLLAEARFPAAVVRQLES